MIRAEGGTSLIEFALLAPVVIFLLLGLIEIGRFAYFSILAGNAARAGVQYGAQSTTSATDVPGMRQAALADGQNVPNLTASPTPAYCTCADGTAVSCKSTAVCPAPSHRLVFVKVVATGTFTSLFKYPGLPQSLPISAMAVMQVPQQ
ncbi:MAG: TadE/TadG family type IV pilus assembly protein [Vulcanimicrobiaceae bacterium]